MSRSECTHLISANATGEKYRTAIKWQNIHVVNIDWFRKSIEKV